MQAELLPYHNNEKELIFMKREIPSNFCHPSFYSNDCWNRCNSGIRRSICFWNSVSRELDVSAGL